MVTQVQDTPHGVEQCVSPRLTVPSARETPEHINAPSRPPVALAARVHPDPRTAEDLSALYEQAIKSFENAKRHEDVCALFLIQS